jgi:hypothetical protein
MTDHIRHFNSSEIRSKGSKRRAVFIESQSLPGYGPYRTDVTKVVQVKVKGGGAVIEVRVTFRGKDNGNGRRGRR